MKKNTAIRKILIKWYDKNGRNFPWRLTDDPYKIMIAEFMLHRTKAEQVVPVYLDFTDKFPDINSLAQADINVVKNYTVTLGLHWRYKHFIEAAKYVLDNYNGIFPSSPKELQKIPGVGNYISSAISIIAFNKPVPIVDSNIARFLNRIHNLKLMGEIRRKKIIIEKATELFSCKKARLLLFAIIDFCNSICKPGKPECYQCILVKLCKYSLKCL